MNNNYTATLQIPIILTDAKAYIWYLQSGCDSVMTFIEYKNDLIAQNIIIENANN